MSENLEPLIETARGGDAHAFRALIEPLGRELHAYAYRILGGFHSAMMKNPCSWSGMSRDEVRVEVEAAMLKIDGLVMKVVIAFLARFLVHEIVQRRLTQKEVT